MGFFKKESCVICNGKTGMFDKKTAEGKICKDCAQKLSPWFEDFKNTATAGLQMQIKDREANQMLLGAIDFDKVYGEHGVILINSQTTQFVAVGDTSTSLFGGQKTVTSIQDVLEFKPDLIHGCLIEDIEIDIVETSREEKRSQDGQMVSYDPQEYTYMYMFYLEIKLKHAYIPRIRIQLNKDAVQIRSVGRRAWTNPGKKLAAHLLDMPQLVVENQAAVYNNDSLVDFFYHSPFEMPAYSYGFAVTHRNWDDIKRYQYYLFMAQQIKQTLQP